MKMPVADNTYDAVYTIEASCHAPDPVSIPSTLTVFCFLWTANLQVACYTEIKRVLKPGQLFAGYEWCITDAYNPDNKDHKRVKVITSSI
jgi:sterol 24-C-methyltransferase